MANHYTLKEIAKDGKALDKIKERVNNRKWLKYSQKVALIVLNEIDLLGISQKELAFKMDVSPQYINKLVKGKEKLNIETISKLETALETDILTISQPRKPEPKGRVVNIDFSIDLSKDLFSKPHEAQG
jgi:ribosome-binding protein aMBF1 (putative translation factor)